MLQLINGQFNPKTCGFLGVPTRAGGVKDIEMRWYMSTATLTIPFRDKQRPLMLQLNDATYINSTHLKWSPQGWYFALTSIPKIHEPTVAAGAC